MGVFRLDRLLDFLHSGALFVALLWLGLIALTVGLVVLMYTRWGRVHPLRKSLALSLLAHALLAGYSTTVYVMPAVLEEFLPVSLALDRSGAPGGLSGESKDADAPSAEPSTTAARAAHTARTLKTRPWEAFGHVSGVRPPMAELARIEPPDLSRPQRQSLGEAGVLAGLPDLDHLPLAEPLLTQPEPLPASHLAPVKKPPKAATGRNAEAIQAPAAERRTGARSSLPGPAQVARPTEPPGPASEPVRSSQAGLPTKLLQRTLPLPRPDEGSVQVTPEGTLAVVTRPPSDSAPRRPADTGDSRLPGTSGQLAGTSGTAPAEAGMMAGSGRSDRGRPLHRRHRPPPAALAGLGQPCGGPARRGGDRRRDRRRGRRSAPTAHSRLGPARSTPARPLSTPHLARPRTTRRNARRDPPDRSRRPGRTPLVH